ncbi:hypothetical protein QR680_017488 [Steinernema hermaphroditum]|uniref:TFIIS N-terminal domain-containing protein n=1 Tax=Steinernema hermaphroditum TaxID=289476 RepID=A0AA39LP87_9BILA|nr:hypothetical protein QR680_017488 [Steinernema hermaphroditum]
MRWSSTMVVEFLGDYLLSGDEERFEYAFGRLESVPITVDRLQRTGVGRIVSKFMEHEEFGDRAVALVKKWRSIAEDEQRLVEDRTKVDGSGDDFGRSSRERRSPSKSRSSTPSSRHASPNPDRSPSPVIVKKKKPRREPLVADNEESGRPSCSSSLIPKQNTKPKPVAREQPQDSFAAMLATANDVKESRTKKHRVEKLSQKPFLSRTWGAKAEPQTLKVDDTDMFKARKDTRKVYAGRRKAILSAEVPRLESLCINVLLMHLNDIEAMNGTPYDLVKPVLEKCTPEQLLHIEAYNEYLLEDTDELWARICDKKYPNEETYKCETWRDFYLRKQRESEEKLRRLASRIGTGKTATISGRTAMQLDAPTAPREVRKRALAFGTSQVTVALPSAIEVSKSRREIFNSGSKSSFQQLPAVIRAAKHSTVGAKTEKRVAAPPPAAGKRGALMAKTLKMMKNRKR